MTTKRIVTLFVIVILSAMLAACGEATSLTNLVAGAASDAVTAQSVRTSPRVSACDFSSKQNLLNAVNAELNQSTGVVDGVTLDDWLNSKMSSFGCIAAIAK